MFCRIGIHKWCKWSSVMRGTNGLFQNRYCKCCDKAEIRWLDEVEIA